MKFDEKTFRLSESGGFIRKALILGVLSLALGVGVFFFKPTQFYYSYLVAYMFWLSVALGAMFFVLLFHLTGTVWGVVLRRIAETMMQVLPYMAVLFIPLVFGLHDVYHWTHPDAADAVLQHKAGYLNVPFFIVRAVIYFVAWYLIARALYKASLKMDENPSQERIAYMRKVSAIGMVVFALTVTFASIDWIMSLEPHWYSTIFGAYIFSGSLLAALSFFVIIPLYLRKKGALAGQITVEHYHDLAKMLFGFTIFWGYMGFSQYFLMWYANIPEETIYFFQRWQGNWKILTMTLVLGHFALPFVLLLPRSLKRNLTFLKYLAYWILLMHWIDLYWMVMVNFHPQGIRLCSTDFLLFFGIGGVTAALFWKFLSAQPLLPVGDPNLQASIEYEN